MVRHLVAYISTTHYHMVTFLITICYHLQGKSSVVRPIHVVVSLGTGRIPPVPVSAVDVYKPEGLFDIVKVATGAKNLGQMLVETVCADLNKALIICL
jgi:hypothetical protein